MNRSMAVEIMRALLWAYVLTGILLVGLALGVYKLRLPEETVNFSIIFIYVFASLMGAYIFTRKRERLRLVHGALLGVGYMVIILFSSALAAGTQMEVTLQVKEILSAIALCLGGGMLGGLLGGT